VPAPVKNRAVALVGLLLLIPLGVGLVRDSLTLETAGIRAAILLVILTVIDRVLVPIVVMIIGEPRPERRAAPRDTP
jgi:hypothetical protein